MINKDKNESKIKPMTKYEMVLALDRISRFKFPEKKLKRVYIETICTHSIPLKEKKSDIELWDNNALADKFTEIWNYSVKENFKELNNDFLLNEKYILQEKSCYVIDENIMKLMPKKADFKTLIKNLGKNEIPNNFTDYATPKKIVLTEGITEVTVLPEFSKIMGYNWDLNGIKIIGIGGKSRLLNRYNIYKNRLKIPIYILLDNDAQNIFDFVQKELRSTDKAHIISCGEIEDIIPFNIFKNAINSEYKLISKISVNDFDKNLSAVKNLHNLFKERGFGEFKKAKVAKLICGSLTKNIKLSVELTDILNEIKYL